MINEEKRAIFKLRECIDYDKKHRLVTIYDEEQIEFRNNIEFVLDLVEKLKKENEELKNKVVKRDKELIELEEYVNKNFEILKHKNLKLIDLLHNEILYYAMSNDGYYWDGTILIKCNEKYSLVEFKGSQSGWIKNQIECVDKEFISNAIGPRILDKVDDSFPTYFNTFLESIYGYPINDEILNQLVTQDAILLDYDDIKNIKVR